MRSKETWAVVAILLVSCAGFVIAGFVGNTYGG